MPIPYDEEDKINYFAIRVNELMKESDKVKSEVFKKLEYSVAYKINKLTGETIKPDIHIDLDIWIEKINNPDLTLDKLKRLLPTAFSHTFEDWLNESFLNWYEVEDLVGEVNRIEELFTFKFDSTYPESEEKEKKEG